MKKLKLITLLFLTVTALNSYAGPLGSASATLPASSSIGAGATSEAFAIPSSIIPPSQLSLPSVIPSGVLSIISGGLTIFGFNSSGI